MIRFAVCVRASVYTYTGIPTHECTTRGQKLKLHVFLNRFQLYFLRQAPSLNPGPTEQLH